MFSLRLSMIYWEEKLDTTSFDIEMEKLKQPVGDRPLTGMLQTRASFSKAIIITKLSGSIVAKSPVVQVEAGLFMVQTQAIKALVRWLFRSLHHMSRSPVLLLDWAGWSLSLSALQR